MQRLPLAVALLLSASGVSAQEADTLGTPLGHKEVTPPAAQASMGELLSKGYQIKAAIPNGSKFVVFMQKDQSAYACEMQSLTASRCGTLN
ncbi:MULTISPECIES: hypothetical protein [Rhizobium]|jgi:hypothetical protein|uniref:Uncharacterized protein n=2 Tax=Rhizobium TaxID=379 RepID=A0A2A5KYM1_9HYPH|nr:MULTISPECIES: hypothetical protein [Rhizobium]AJC78835.1 hypothetical protein IE4803_CH01607 [Rhizobium etli bv. phaseoli str. IE4803]UWU35934.1 hypothetical protein N2597_06405 [Rhizobium leguminosarum bv. phaseoli]AIC26798.1 hypothetical protein IE4771_CH01660 [Rhizobium sp. IE4771]ARQ57816.1 hypothetical protein Kim5_CH01730 [Rhizobium sp. Kim5]PCK82139.1 hypothetical protein CPT34_04105 [Rhizobium sophoriradicis]